MRGRLFIGVLLVFFLLARVAAAPAVAAAAEGDAAAAARTKAPTAESVKPTPPESEIMGPPKPEAPAPTENANNAARAAGETSVATKKGITVLGHYPEYADVAKARGANYLNIDEQAWNAMTDAEKWAVNQKFLDEAIARNDCIILATRIEDIKPGSFFEREIQYLEGKGYKPNADGTQMIPPPKS